MRHFPFLLAWFLAPGVIACGGRPINPRATTISALPASTAAGKLIYEEFCVSCHGADGKGTELALHDGKRVNLTTALRYYSAEEMITVIIEGTSGTTMASWSNLTDQEIADVYAYMRALPK